MDHVLVAAAEPSVGRSSGLSIKVKQSCTHSATLPCMSWSPKAFGLNDPVSAVLPHGAPIGPAKNLASEVEIVSPNA